MKFLLRILHRFRVIIVFVILEAINLLLMFSHNDYQNAELFVTSNRVFGNIYQWSSRFSNFVSLDKQNRRLQEENAKLRHTINEIRLKDFKSSVLMYQNYIPAKVVSNTVGYTHNYIVLNKGTKDGIKPRMGVITSNGIVGKVKECSDHFSVAFSLLNPKLMVAGRIYRTSRDSVVNQGQGTVRWVNSLNPSVINLLDFTAYVPIHKQDTVVTVGYDGVFPSNHPIGIVQNVRKAKGVGREVEIKLNTDLSAVSHVYIVNTPSKKELDSLKNSIIIAQ